jgi:hypothetical protein
MSADIRKSDLGTTFRLVIVDQDGETVSLVGATIKEIHFKRPNATVDKLPASFFTDGADGILQVILNAIDYLVVGNWEYQGYVELPDGKWHTDIFKFIVLENLA